MSILQVFPYCAVPKLHRSPPSGVSQTLQTIVKSAVILILATAVVPCFAQSFGVTASPSALTIFPGQQNVPMTVNVSAGSYTGPVTVTLTGLPSGITVSPLTISGTGSGTLNVSATVFAGQEGFSSLNLPTNTSWTAPVTMVATVGSVQAVTQIPLTISISNPSFAPAASAINLPIVSINTNGTPVITKTDKIPGTITITSANKQATYLPNASDSDNTATFHVHGNSTAVMPKLAYHISLNTSLDLLYTMGLQCPYVTGKGAATCDKSKSYILLANYDDKTLLRDWSASALANSIPIGNGYLNSSANSPSPSGTSTLLPWAAHSLFVELYLNGAYMGTYQLIEEVKVDSHRVNINELSETDTSASAVTGGYLMEIDDRESEAFVFKTPQGYPIGLIDPDFTPDPEVQQQTSYISNYVSNAENALFSSTFTDPILGWRGYFDEASVVNFYIVNEVMGNADGGAFVSSDYLYKDLNNPLIYMGPVWDFDISAGNVNYQPIVSPVVPWMQVANLWYPRWFSDPTFAADMTKQWNALKTGGVFTQWIASIQQQSQSLAQSQANNFARWPMIGTEVWPNSEAAGSYTGEVQNLTQWLTLRIAYLDSLFNQKAPTQVSLTTSGATPIALTAQVSGGTSPGGLVSFLYNGILLGSATLSGNTATLNASLAAGTYTVQAVYQGDNNNALSASSIAGLTVRASQTSTVTALAGPFSTGFTAAVIRNSGSGAPAGTVSFTVDSGTPVSLTLDSTGEAIYSPGILTTGSHTIHANYMGNNSDAPSTATITFQAGALTTAPVPLTTITPVVTGVANSASGSAAAPEVVSPGSYISIYGTNLTASGAASATTVPLPTTLNGTQVSLGGLPMPMNYAGTGQINAIVPQGLAPNATYPLVVTLQSGAQSTPLSLFVGEYEPGLYTRNQTGVGAGVITNALTYALNTSSNPAHAGDYLTIYCTGLGAVLGQQGQAAPADGAAAPLSFVYSVTAQVTATIDGVPATVTFAGLTPSLVGLYQVNVLVPNGVTPGNTVPVTITATDRISGTTGRSNSVSIAVQ